MSGFLEIRLGAAAGILLASSCAAPAPEASSDASGALPEAASSAAAGAGGAGAGQGAEPGLCDDACLAEVERARRAAERYLDPARALADGFVPLGSCVDSGDEPGYEGPPAAMGQHWGRLDRMGAPAVEIESPEVLLYLPDGRGGYELGGLEYYQLALVDGAPYVGDEPPPADRVSAPASLFGRTFEGPQPGREPGQPWHYDLHVWAFVENPAGLFAAFNPARTCP